MAAGVARIAPEKEMGASRKGPGRTCYRTPSRADWRTEQDAVTSPGMNHAGATDDPGSPRLYHGTRADRKPGDLIGPGYSSNYGTRKKANHVYFSATLNAAIWGAELA